MEEQNSRTKRSDIYASIAIVLFLFYSFYYSLFRLTNRYLLETLLVGGSFVLGIISILTEQKRIMLHKKLIKYMNGWILIIVLFLIFRNWWNTHASIFTTIKWIWVIIMAFVLCQSIHRIYGIYKKIIVIGFPHVISVIFFFFFRSSYSVMYRVFGEWPSGTGNGRFGFRAGISNHYSLNGIYLAIVFLSCLSYTLTAIRQKKKNIILWSIFTIVSLFSLILSTKRAHIIFSILAIMITLFLYFQRISKKQLFRFIGFILIIFFISVIVYNKFPEINTTLQRFENLDEDSNINFRFTMWGDALNMFSDNPLIGIGWSGFRYSSGYGKNAHNVYIQLLAETGIIGFSIYIITLLIIGITLICQFRKIVSNNKDESFVISFASLLFYFFYILYSLSGNCLFDITFNFFVFPLSAGFLLRVKK